MTDIIVSPTGGLTAIDRNFDDALGVLLFSARAVTQGTVPPAGPQAGSVALPAVANLRDSPGVFDGLDVGAVAVDKDGFNEVQVRASVTADPASTTVSWSVLLYVSDNGLDWFLQTSFTFTDTNALIGGNPPDTGMAPTPALGGTTRRSSGFVNFVARYVAVVVRKNDAGTFTVNELRLVRRR